MQLLTTHHVEEEFHYDRDITVLWPLKPFDVTSVTDPPVAVVLVDQRFVRVEETLQLLFADMCLRAARGKVHLAKLQVHANPVTSDEMKRCEYREYNFNMSLLYSPHLVSAETVFDLYLDEIDESWTTKIQSFDYVIISAGHWFFHPPMFYLNHRLVGCLDCSQSNVSHLTSYFSYRRAFQMAFRAINSLQNYNGVIFLRTFAPSHFENGTWSNGGDCTKTRPFRRNEMVLDSHNLEFYKIQLQEVRIAQKEGRKRGLKFRLFDVTRPMLLRPDGHPSKYGRWTKPNATVLIDCLHWCLPGPIDTWNDFLLQLLKREAADI
nr:protein trichome birefringence-like 19 [Nicotiana tomentosiformis]